MPGRAGLLSNKTKSRVPKTPKQKRMWIRARQIATKQEDAKSDKTVNWKIVQKIYKNAKKAGKVPKKSDVTKAKPSKKK